MILNDEDGWLGVKVGDNAITVARFNSAHLGSRSDPGHNILVDFPDGSGFSFTCDDARMARDFTPGTLIHVLARRTECGMHALAFWTPGGPTIYLGNDERDYRATANV